MPIVDELGAAALAAVIDRLRSIVPNLGSVYFVDCDAGIDLPGRGTYALPLRTIDYAVSNYAVAWANDAFICWGSAGGGFDENVNVDGVQVDVPSTIICAYNNVRIDNTNAGATSIFNISVNQCWILGFRIQPTVATIGILNSGINTKVGFEDFQNIFDNCTVDVRTTGANGHYRYNEHINSSIGYDVRSARNEIYKNHMESAGAGGTIGITTTAAGDRNFIRENVIFGYATGINIIVGATGNVMVENSLLCTANVADANGINVNGWIHNKTRSRIRHVNTVQEDLKDIFDEAQGGGGGGGDETRVGDIFFVSTTGNDVTGEGSLGNPWATIDFAVGQCQANHNDFIIVYSANGAVFNENVNVGGVICDVAGITIQGIDTPGVQNTNAGATAIFTVQANNVKIFGLGFADAPPPAIPQIDTDAGGRVGTEVANCVFMGIQDGIRFDTITGGKIYNNRFAQCVNIAIQIETCNGVKVYDNDINRCGTGAILLDVGANQNCHIYRNRIHGDNVGYGININIGANNLVSENWLGNMPNPFVDAPLGNTWVDNHVDLWLVTDTIEVADGIVETPVVGSPAVSGRSGTIEIHIQTDTLDTNEIGSVVRYRLYAQVNGIQTPFHFHDHICGVNPLNPVLRASVPGNANSWQMTAQMNIAVAAQRIVRYNVLME